MAMPWSPWTPDATHGTKVIAASGNRRPADRPMATRPSEAMSTPHLRTGADSAALSLADASRWLLVSFWVLLCKPSAPNTATMPMAISSHVSG